MTASFRRRALLLLCLSGTACQRGMSVEGCLGDDDSPYTVTYSFSHTNPDQWRAEGDLRVVDGGLAQSADGHVVLVSDPLEATPSKHLFALDSGVPACMLW